MIRRFVRVLVTLLVLALAVYLGWRLWHAYMDLPWTRDAVVQAQIVEINGDVSGRVTQVLVKDNQSVAAGALLFRIDPQRYQLALDKAQATLAEASTRLALRREQAARRAGLPAAAVSAEARSDAELAVRVAAEQLRAAQAAVRLAAYDLSRTAVRAPVAGTITHLRLRAGDYAQQGQALLALVEAKSYWIDAYFEQTRLRGVHIGEHARITLLGAHESLPGIVESIAPAIADRESQTGERLQARVRASFNWVRLPSRIPVRIRLLKNPNNFPLVAGMICSVRIEKKSQHQ
ncbi:efflux RND transporter periplasmic adaptor subunit [Acidithiobacillus marinus]|uniref:efflux RND transporter periplasmic adaptor subunit n=1 Tax=Acidithiobacillus marinus TaxID=187490 RepID=UPI001C0EE763|nr:HlyD family secretion protein [Acidithiobacillus marinus]